MTNSIENFLKKDSSIRLIKATFRDRFESIHKINKNLKLKYPVLINLIGDLRKKELIISIRRGRELFIKLTSRGSLFRREIIEASMFYFCYQEKTDKKNGNKIYRGMLK